MNSGFSKHPQLAIDRSPRGNVWNLQILRFVAAGMVLFSHLSHEVTQRPGMAPGFHPFLPIWWAGGVDIFFVISGFIMHYISADAFGRPGAPLHFVKRRLVRLVPPYWFFTTLALVAVLLLPSQIARNSVSVAQVVGSFLFIPTIGLDGKAYPVLILGWTLNFEMLFYVIFAIGLRFKESVGLIFIAAVLIVFAFASMLQPLPTPLGFWCNNIVLEFLFGIGLSMLHRHGVRFHAMTGVALASGGVVALLAVEAAGWPGMAWNWRFLWAGLPSALICAGVVLVPDDGQPGSVRRVFIYLGDASFALYLSHPFVLSLVAIATAKAGLRSAGVYMATAAVACLAGAVLFFSLIEKPVYRWLSEVIARKRGQVRP